MIEVKFKVLRESFFDRKAVTSKVDAAVRKQLSRFGAFVRQTARNSIRKNKKTSKPGAPPYSHVGTLKALIFFAYDPDRKSVVIGPTLTTAESRVPSLLENGGEVVVTDPKGRSRVLRYEPRPFMGPAFAKEMAKIDSLWKNSVR